MATVYGSQVGPTSKFRFGIFYSITYGASTWTIKYKVGVKVDSGNFQSSFIQYHGLQQKIGTGNYTSPGWNPNGSTLDTSGMYCVSGQKTASAAYGEKIIIRGNVGYTGNSGTTYRSWLTATFSATAPYVSYDPTVYIYNNGKWNKATPYIYSNGWKKANVSTYNNGWKSNFSSTNHAGRISVNKTTNPY